MFPLTLLSRFGLAAIASATVAEAVGVDLIFNFTTYVSIENSIVRPNGLILFSTLSNANVYQIDPSANNPQAEIVATLPGATGLNGFAQIGADKYAIAGGVRGTYHYDNETIYTIDFSGNRSGATTGIAATLPDAVLLNGAASLPANEEIVLLADSVVGCIWRVNTTSGCYEKAIEGDFLTAPANASALPIGVNGLKVRAGYVWFTNTYTGVFGRVPIDSEGYPTGDSETIATVSAANSWDDFNVLADDGASMACQSPDTVSLISHTGVVTPIIGMNATEGLLLGCSSIVVTAGAQGNRSAYVTTKGSYSSGLGGQIFHIAT